MRGLPPDVFEVRLRHNHHDDRGVIEVWSRMYDIRLGYTLRAMWGDPRRLCDYIENLIGGTVRCWYESRVGTASGREMAQALMPHWEREIHHNMERMEHEDRLRGRRDWYFYDEMSAIRPDQWDALLYGPFGAPEDPKARAKARQLLLRNLDAGQEESFKKDGSFRVTAKDGKVYTVKTARSFNVVAEDGTKYCGQTVDTPVEDQMLAQKLLLEHEPEKFFKNANVSPASGAMTATEINIRQNQMIDMVRLRPGSIINWDTGAV